MSVFLIGICLRKATRKLGMLRKMLRNVFGNSYIGMLQEIHGKTLGMLRENLRNVSRNPNCRNVQEIPTDAEETLGDALGKPEN